MRDLKRYTGIIIAVTVVPAVVTFIIFYTIYRCWSKSESLMLVVMKNIISRRNIDKRPTYLVCNRKLPSSSRRHFMLNSIVIVSIIVQSFFLLAVFDATYECINDPNLDCFKKRDDWQISNTYSAAYHETPVNCSTISKDVFVICYRVTVFDPDRGFIAAASAYVLFQVLNFVLLIVANIMLWAAKKYDKTYLLCFKTMLSAIIVFSMITPPILRIYLDEVESEFQKVSFTVLLQVALIVLVVLHLIIRVPWKEFGDGEEYFDDASLSSIVGAHDNEMVENSPNIEFI